MLRKYMYVWFSIVFIAIYIFAVLCIFSKAVFNVLQGHYPLCTMRYALRINIGVSVYAFMIHME